MSSAREVYWISAELSPAEKEKISGLKRLQIEAIILADFSSLARTYPSNRLNTIIVNDACIDGKASDQLGRLMIHPEYAGVRFILSISQDSNQAIQRAVSLGFRDVLPVDLRLDLWLRRYSFATTGHASDDSEPSPQITMKNISALNVPVRIAWMNETELWLEGRLKPQLGTTLPLGGSIASYLGVKHLTVKVIEHSSTNLQFRYSDALICQWNLPKTQETNKLALLEFFKQQPAVIPLRLYTIIRTQELRRTIVKFLDPQKFQLAFALNKTAMIHEPKFINPDLILVEDRMCTGQNRQAFKAMLENLQQDVPIIVIGPSTMQDRFDDIPESIQITRVPRLPPDLADYLAKQAGTLKREHSGVTFIPKNHPLSFGYLSVPARLTRVHPDAAQLAISHPMGRFGICGLDSALFKKTLGRTVHFKVSNCHRHEQLGLQDFPYKIEGLLVDIRQKERHSLARYLIEYYSEKILDLDSHLQIDNKSNSQYIRPIEAIRSDSTPSTSVLAISPEAMVKTENPSTQNSSPKRTANILINPSREDVYPDNAIDRAVASWGRIGQEWKIFAFTLLFFGLLFSLIFLLRGPQEDLSGGLTEQLRIFKEMHQGSQTQPIQP